MRYYVHMYYAFLYEFAVGLLTLYCVFAVGKVGIAVLALIAARPFLLKMSDEPPDARIWRIFYQAGKWSLLLTALTILITYFLFDYLPVSSHDRGIIFLTTIPWFVVIHGLVGFILVWPDRLDTLPS